MRKVFTKQFLLCLVLCLFTGLAFAQQKRTITGTVKDEQGAPVPFASVQVKGTTIGATTGDDGSFSLSVDEGAVLVVKSIGYDTKEVRVGTASTVAVTLGTSSSQLSEVVVTALGIEREKKSLGYAVQEVGGERLVESREANLANALTGKVAGLQITRSSNGPAGSSKIVLRGNNSLVGDNQPLIVVDGIPIDNFTGRNNNDYWNPGLDMGNGLADINAEDIESISVLKGPSAAALYGSRAGNGVILITTKSGRPQEGLGITISSTVGYDEIFTYPQLQNVFGQGTEGSYNEQSGLSWGPRAEGQPEKNWRGESAPLRIYDNIDNFFGKGLYSSQNVSFQQQYNKTSVYTSFNRFDNEGISPGVELSRTNLMARAVSHFGKTDRWTTDTKVQYTKSDARNRPIGGNNPNNSFGTLFGLPRSIDVRDFEQAVDEEGKMIWYGSSSQMNPYWNGRYNLNQDVRDRFILNGSVKYDFTDWMSAEIKGGGDMHYTTAENKLYGGSPQTPSGRYSLNKQNFMETNYSTLLTAQRDNVIGRLGGMVTLGGNLMSQKFSSISGSAGELEVPNLFSLNNGRSNPSVGQDLREHKINSVYGSVQFNWDGYLFLDATFRNDWSSTLSKENRSYFYPSLSASYVFTDMLETIGGTAPSWLSFGKLRASYAEVGNSLGPYELYNTYWVGKDPIGNPTAGRNPILYNPNLRSELVKAYEAGLEARFFNNRIGVDVAWYKSNATRQLINLPMDPLSGYSFRKINAGDIQNKGVEVMVNAELIRNPAGFNWNITGNFSRNRNTVEDLYEDIEVYPLGGFDDVRVWAVVGGEYGEIYGSTFKRVDDPESPYHGQLLLTSAGLPAVGEQGVRLGNQQADALVGVINSLRYKGLGLTFQVDARIGGEIFSGTHVSMQRNGTGAATLRNGGRESFVVEGVIQDPNTGAYTVNTTAVTPQNYWNAVAGVGNLGITEANIYDATNVRLRNVQLSYALPSGLLSRLPLQRASVGVTATNVWLISSHMDGLDPESVFATGTNATGFENGSMPTTRSVLFNLTLGF
ncbi:SusC/RagA family TonB-linked outer membrane protein [Pontibacter ramchanderi]|uniref:TonB-linked SusC/RagA family outer membrane protein n=1 Tax=Pontibacter ramchanderi TaxID=1179743 RepID=A0A2N3U887_9BACT|nr:SusC/RagA family TonB-linked outer membrane protein [Pontibacter ramchanderi]PKV62944.1 TonB-linked SusC/RagA family outer membrane protein [Pontibacter ramchanderi]